MNKQWENFGDVNPIEHGGIWVKQDEDDKNAYYIVKNELIDGNEDTQRVVDLYVDTEDSWIEKESVMSYLGMSQENYNPIQFAIGLTDYYSFENFGTKTDTGSKEKTKEELKNFDIQI